MSHGWEFCPRCATPLAWRQQAGRERQSCDNCGFVHWDNPLPVLAAVVEYQERILLAWNASWPEERYALITGFMERDETPEEGVARELKEETNLDAESISLLGVYEFQRKNELIIAYHVVASGTVELAEELAGYRLFHPLEIKPWRRATGLALAEWMRARDYPVEFSDTPPRGPYPDAVIVRRGGA